MEKPPVRLAESSFTPEPRTCACARLYSSSLFTRRLPKGFTAVDFDLEENLVELEDTKTGNRYWTNLFRIFGKIVEIGSVLMRKENGEEEELIIHDVKPLQYGSNNYLQLIFCPVSYELPF